MDVGHVGCSSKANIAQHHLCWDDLRRGQGIGADIAPNAQEQLLARLMARAAAHHQAQAAALAADPQQIPDAALRLRELSALQGRPHPQRGGEPGVCAALPGRSAAAAQARLAEHLTAAL